MGKEAGGGEQNFARDIKPILAAGTDTYGLARMEFKCPLLAVLASPIINLQRRLLRKKILESFLLQQAKTINAYV